MNTNKQKATRLLHFISVLILACAINACNNNGNAVYKPSTPQEKQEEWIDCDICNGRGYFTRTCSSCEGKGRLIASISQTKTRSCRSCAGTGIAPCTACGNYGYYQCTRCNSLTGKVRCTACNGAGRLAYNFGGELIFKECGLCDGSGYTICGNCNGKGRITCQKCWGEGHIKCPTCNGTGGPDLSYSEKIDQGPCPACNGTGQVKVECEECEGVGRVKVE